MLVTVRGGRYPLLGHQIDRVLQRVHKKPYISHHRDRAAAGAGAARGRQHLVHQPVGLPHAHLVAGHLLQRRGAAALRQAQRGAGMALAQVVGRAKLLLLGCQGQKAQLVGQRGLAQSQTAGSLGLGAAPQPDDLLDAARRVKRVQLAALQIFEKSQRGGFAVVIVGKDSGDLFQLGQPAGTQPALPCHKLIFADADPPHADGLQQPVLQDADRQRSDFRLIKGGARLIG